MNALWMTMAIKMNSFPTLTSQMKMSQPSTFDMGSSEADRNVLNINVNKFFFIMNKWSVSDFKFCYALISLADSYKLLSVIPSGIQ